MGAFSMPRGGRFQRGTIEQSEKGVPYDDRNSPSAEVGFNGGAVYGTYAFRARMALRVAMPMARELGELIWCDIFMRIETKFMKLTYKC